MVLSYNATIYEVSTLKSGQNLVNKHFVDLLKWLSIRYLLVQSHTYNSYEKKWLPDNSVTMLVK